MDDFFDVFTYFVRSAVPYAIVWRLGLYIVGTLVDWITGGRRGRVEL